MRMDIECAAGETFAQDLKVGQGVTKTIPQGRFASEAEAQAYRAQFIAKYLGRS
jgi:hypothetical protein